MTETITLQQIGMLLALAAARDQRTVGDADVLAWHADLNTARIAFDDAQAALTHFYAVETPTLSVEDRFRITAPDVISIARRQRTKRLENFTYEPPALEQDPAYLARLRGQIRAVASGAVPAPTHAPMLEGGPHPDVAARLGGIGKEVPGEASPIRRPGARGVECPACKALIGRECKTPGGKQRSPHPARSAAAGVPGSAAPMDPELARAEAERRRLASRTLLDQMPDGTP